MSDHREVHKNISTLESMIPGLLSFGKPDWKAIWDQIRITGQSFKGTRFPTREEHQKAWDKFQQLVSNVKARQEQDQKGWERKKDESERLRNMIVSHAKDAQPCASGLADILITIATGGVNLALDAIKGSFDEEKQMLQSCSQRLNEGWALLQNSKDKMLGRDKAIAFAALSEAKDALDSRWDRYKRERQRSWDNYQRERSEKHRNREQKIEANISALEERRSRLNAALSNKERNLDKLQDMLSEARSDDFRSRVSGWISEEESSIIDIKEKLKKIEDWIYESRSDLRS
jgi:chromosome segregation ATPase